MSVTSELDSFLASLPAGSSVSCRSSATGEDSAASSFAGQFETDLNCHGTKRVSEAILQCWASMWQPHVLMYRHQILEDNEGGKQDMAVVVQLQVASVASGVAFTCNPNNGLDSEIVVEAVWGQGEGMVQGEISPDRYIVDSDSNEVLLRDIRVKRQRFDLTAEGTTKSDVPVKLMYKPTLSQKQLQELVSLCVTLKMHYERPVDIEFATSPQGGQVLLLQVRPVTVAVPRNDNKRTLKWSYKTKTVLKCNKQILKPLSKVPLNVLYVHARQGIVHYTVVSQLRYTMQQ
jgi:pyruvate,water dikinase